jgi:hypothetical protein
MASRADPPSSPPPALGDTDERAVVATYRAARDHARWRLTWRLRWQVSRARRRSTARALDVAEWAVLAAVSHELKDRGVAVPRIRPG